MVVPNSKKFIMKVRHLILLISAVLLSSVGTDLCKTVDEIWSGFGKIVVIMIVLIMIAMFAILIKELKSLERYDKDYFDHFY